MTLGLLILWWRCSSLCTSGFTDDVNEPYGDVTPRHLPPLDEYSCAGAGVKFAIHSFLDCCGVLFIYCRSENFRFASNTSRAAELSGYSMNWMW